VLTFASPHVAEVETALEASLQGGWRRATETEVWSFRHLEFTSAWRIDLNTTLHLNPSVDFIVVGTNGQFPFSEPKAVAPQAKSKNALSWPHVEENGILCLKTTKYDLVASKRILRTIQDALELFQMPESERTKEFQREFLSYWTHGATITGAKSISLVRPDGTTREVFYVYSSNGLPVFSDSEAALANWLDNTGHKPQKHFAKSLLTWLDPIPEPKNYPLIGSDAMALVGKERVLPYLVAGHNLPMLIGAMTPTGAIFAGMTIKGASEKVITKGFRKSTKFPQHLLPNFFQSLSISRFRVERADADWVYGRDVNAFLGDLRMKTVAVVGCGAIGGYLARILVQSGVGKLVLIDDDRISTSNPSRHILGQDFRDQKKPEALGNFLKKQFPSTIDIRVINSYFEKVATDSLTELISITFRRCRNRQLAQIAGRTSALDLRLGGAICPCRPRCRAVQYRFFVVGL
jgi:hypothetical protein